MRNAFSPKFGELPATLPLFPLEGAVVLPHGQLPLNIFEPRYLNMVFDALADARLIGMIQPLPDSSIPEPALHQTGCAGRIVSFSETRDGRLLIVLGGLCSHIFLGEHKQRLRPAPPARLRPILGAGRRRRQHFTLQESCSVSISFGTPFLYPVS